MGHLLSSLSCCWFWLIAGVLIGWLLNRWLCRCCCKTDTPPTANPPRSASAPLVSAPAEPVQTITTVPPKVTPATKPAAKPSKPKSPPKAKLPAKPKTAAKPVVSFDLAAARAAGFTIKQADDLTVIEGIGPKINELFKENGVGTFAALAQQSVPQMRAILDKGGARYRMANPATWAQQASLAANNQWAALKALQDKLSGGVKK